MSEEQAQVQELPYKTHGHVVRCNGEVFHFANSEAEASQLALLFNRAFLDGQQRMLDKYAATLGTGIRQPIPVEGVIR